MKKNLKKVLALGMAASMAFTGFAGAAYTDQADIKATEAVDMLNALGVMTGDPDGSFRPNDTITRAEAARMIYTIRNGGNADASAYAGMQTTFTDVPSTAWYAGYVKHLQAMGVVSGTSETTFSPDDNVTTVELALMCLRVMGFDPVKADIGGSTWSTKTIGYATEHGLLDDVNTSVTDACPRQWAAQLMANAIEANTVRWSEDAGIYTNRDFGSGFLETVGSKFMNLKIFIGTLSGNYDTGNTSGLKDAIYITNGWLTSEDSSSARSATLPSDMDISNIGEQVKVLFRDGTSGTSDTPDKYDTIFGVYNTGNTTVYNITKADLQDAGTEVANGKIKFNDTLYTVASFANDTDVVINKNYGASTSNTAAVDVAVGGDSGTGLTAVEFATYINTPANGLRVKSTDTIKFVCNDNGAIDCAYVMDSKTSELTGVSDSKVHLAGETAKEQADCVGFENVAVGDMVRFVDLYPSSTRKTAVVEKAAVVEGKITAHNLTGNAVQIDGTWYEYNGHNSFVNSDYTAAALTDSDVGNTVSLILDGNKFYGAYDVISGFNNFGLVTWAGTNVGEDTVRALLSDGTTKAYANIGTADGGITLGTGALQNTITNNNHTSTGSVLYAYNLEGENTKVKLNVPTGYVVNTGDAASNKTHNFNSSNMTLTVIGQGADTTKQFIVNSDAVVFLYDTSATKWKTYTASDLGTFNMTDATRIQYIVKDNRVVAFAGTVANAPTAGSNTTQYGYVVKRIDDQNNDSDTTTLYIWNGTEEVALLVDGRTVLAYPGDFIQYPVMAEGAMAASSDIKLEVSEGAAAGALNFVTTKIKDYKPDENLLITTSEQIGADGKPFGGTDTSYFLPADVQIIGVDTADKAASTANTPVKYTTISGSDYNNAVVVYEVNAGGYSEVKAIFIDENGKLENSTTGGTGSATGQAGAAIAITDYTTPITTLGGSASNDSGVTISATSDKATAVPGETVTVTVTVGGTTNAGAAHIVIGGVTPNAGSTTVLAGATGVTKFNDTKIDLANNGATTGTFTFTYTMGATYVSPTFTGTDGAAS